MKKISMVILIILSGCNYDSYDECITNELQKFQYQPSLDDRLSVQSMCEIMHPYERELFNVDFKWYGETIKIEKKEDYTVTKIEIYTYKSQSGNCELPPDSPLKLEYLFLKNRSIGWSVDWLTEYTCYLPKKSKVFGLRKTN